MRMSKKSDIGFTLIELLVVITIIAVLALTGLATYGNFVKNSRDTKRQSDLKFIQSALENYFSDQLFYPDVNLPFGSGALTNCTGAPSPCTVTKTYLNTIPKEPTSTTQYKYDPLPLSCSNILGGIKCSSYCLFAKLETSSPPTSDPGCTPSGSYNFGVTRP